MRTNRKVSYMRTDNDQECASRQNISRKKPTKHAFICVYILYENIYIYIYANRYVPNYMIKYIHYTITLEAQTVLPTQLHEYVHPSALTS